MFPTLRRLLISRRIGSMPEPVSVACGQKRGRDGTDTEDTTSILLHSAKRAKRTCLPYESLSKLFLTPRALKELNRQTPKLAFSSHKPLALDGRFPVLEELGVDRVEHLISGGPDLSDLRGVGIPI
jgi:hypothetical protein